MTIVLILVMAVLVIAGINIILGSKKTKEQKEFEQARRYRKLYNFLSRFFITQFYIEGIYRKLANLSIYKKDELNELSVKFFVISWGGGLGLIVAGILLFNDVLNVIIVATFGFLLTNVIIDKQLDRMNEKVIKATSVLLSSIRQEYLRTGSVVEAITDAPCPKILKKPMDEIASILTSADSELKFEEFSSSTPYRVLQTLASICYHINNEGDTEDQFGQSNFVQALTILMSDVNAELQKIDYRKKRFGKIEYLPLLPIFGITPIETYFMSIMPGTALIYMGPIGYLTKTITVLSSMICYLIVSRINADLPVKQDDRSDMIMRFLKKPAFRRLIKDIAPKNKARFKVQRNLKLALSRMTVEEFYAKKLISGALAFILAVVTIFSTTSLGREFIRTSTQELSLVATQDKTGFQEQAIRNLDNEYFANRELYDTNQVAMNDLIKKHLPSLTDLQVQDQIKRLQNKARTLENAYFKWWFFWVAVLVGLIGWYAPNLMLSIRKILIQTEEEEDFLQIQTLVSILMNTNIDTLDLLYQLSQQSRIHKEMFLYAFHGYPSNPELELARLKSKTPIIQFKQFLSKLELTISDLSLKEAFGDLLIEREHMVRMRESSTRHSINRRRSIASPLSMIPLGALVIGVFLIPIGILGYNEFMNALNF